MEGDSAHWPDHMQQDFTSTENTQTFTQTLPSPGTGRVNFANGADWDIGSDAPIVADNRHIVIPLMSFVFGFPVLVITVLCVIQQRNKWLYERQHIRLQQQRRFSTASTIFTGYPSARLSSGAYALQKEISPFGPVRSSIPIREDSPCSASCSQHSSLSPHGQQQNGILVSGGALSVNGQRSRKPSIRFSADTTREEQEMDTLDNRQTICIRSPLLTVGPQNIMDKLGYVEA